MLEMVQNSPGIRGEQLADRLGMTDRAVRRYVGNLRDAGIPVESTRGKYGGYRIGRGVRLAPLMFTASEALGLVMAVLEGRAHDPTDPVGQAVGKIIRVLPQPVAEPVEAVVRMSERTPDGHSSAPEPQVTAAIVQGCASRRRLRLAYRLGPGKVRDMDVDPWAIVVRFGKWYVLGWSHTADARRILRIDRVVGVRGAGRDLRGAGRPRPRGRHRGAPLRRLDPQDRGRRRRPDRGREVLGPPQAGPSRGDRRATPPGCSAAPTSWTGTPSDWPASRGPSGWSGPTRCASRSPSWGAECWPTRWRPDRRHR